ncbi:MAG: phosphoglycerate mutase family protein [Chthoniobacterales bacterium]
MATTAGTGAAAEARIIFVVRHAERADALGAAQSDPDLSELGRAHALALAKELRDADIATIYASEFKRTQETAAPLAASLGLKVEIVPAKDGANLVADLKKAKGNVLVVGHSNTVPEIIKNLGIAASLSVSESDYDDLFLVVLATKPRLIHLHYR